MRSNVTDLTDLKSDLIKIAVLSDTHGMVDPRIRDLVSKCSVAIHAGDIGTASVLNELTPKLGIVVAVRGNNDTESNWDSSESYLLEYLPMVRHIIAPGGTISIEHGHRIRDAKRYHEELRKHHPDSKLVVYGHTHRRVVDRKQLPWVINPGAAGRVRTLGGPSCLVVNIADNVWSIKQHCFRPERPRHGLEKV